jgi:hypothetical protein
MLVAARYWLDEKRWKIEGKGALGSEVPRQRLDGGWRPFGAG